MKIHTELKKCRALYLLPTLALGTRREPLSEHSIGLVRFFSLLWLTWELRFFTQKRKLMHPVGENDRDFLCGIERQNHVHRWPADF